MLACATDSSKFTLLLFSKKELRNYQTLRGFNKPAINFKHFKSMISHEIYYYNHTCDLAFNPLYQLYTNA